MLLDDVSIKFYYSVSLIIHVHHKQDSNITVPPVFK